VIVVRRVDGVAGGKVGPDQMIKPPGDLDTVKRKLRGKQRPAGVEHTGHARAFTGENRSVNVEENQHVVMVAASRPRALMAFCHRQALPDSQAGRARYPESLGFRSQNKGTASGSFARTRATVRPGGGRGPGVAGGDQGPAGARGGEVRTMCDELYAYA
jgi:hypothetical protein